MKKILLSLIAIAMIAGVAVALPPGGGPVPPPPPVPAPYLDIDLTLTGDWYGTSDSVLVDAKYKTNEPTDVYYDVKIKPYNAGGDWTLVKSGVKPGNQTTWTLLCYALFWAPADFPKDTGTPRKYSVQVHAYTCLLDTTVEKTVVVYQ